MLTRRASASSSCDLRLWIRIFNHYVGSDAELQRNPHDPLLPGYALPLICGSFPETLTILAQGCSRVEYSLAVITSFPCAFRRIPSVFRLNDIADRWYRRAEAQKRFTVFFSSNMLAGSFAGAPHLLTPLILNILRPCTLGLLAYAIGHMDGVRGYHGWRWIFILGTDHGGQIQPGVSY